MDRSECTHKGVIGKTTAFLSIRVSIGILSHALQLPGSVCEKSCKEWSPAGGTLTYCTLASLHHFFVWFFILPGCWSAADLTRFSQFSCLLVHNKNWFSSFYSFSVSFSISSLTEFLVFSPLNLSVLLVAPVSVDLVLHPPCAFNFMAALPTCPSA